MCNSVVSVSISVIVGVSISVIVSVIVAADITITNHQYNQYHHHYYHYYHHHYYYHYSALWPEIRILEAVHNTTGAASTAPVHVKVEVTPPQYTSGSSSSGSGDIKTLLNSRVYCIIKNHTNVPNSINEIWNGGVGVINNIPDSIVSHSNYTNSTTNVTSTISTTTLTTSVNISVTIYNNIIPDEKMTVYCSSSSSDGVYMPLGTVLSGGGGSVTSKIIDKTRCCKLISFENNYNEYIIGRCSCSVV